ncbi:MAG: sporulation membrane protein YtaF [Clostridiales bacterium]|nr:sporulation membrane protein YtaF [Clostridiales bacterium]
MMHFALLAILEAALLAASLSLDAFTAGFAYGANKTKLPMLSVQIINLICSGVTGISLFVGVLIKPYLPQRVTLAVSFAVLLLIGLAKLLDSVTKSVIRKHRDINRKISASFFNFKFVLHVYANPELADIDASKSISPKEAVLLALALSLDGIAVGLGAALTNVNAVAVLLCSLVTNTIFMIFGRYLGHKLASKTSFDLSWLSGAVLIGLAISKFF